ncbi:hypothetical protein Q3G72_011537 [Acer saccharum]|nr:hypothetical protein Q3G72_011537 [Acer saccharum]
MHTVPVIFSSTPKVLYICGSVGIDGICKALQLFKQLKESCIPHCFLGIDTGNSFTRFVITSFDVRSAWPHMTCYAKKPKQLLNRIVKLIDKERVGGCLVGYSPMDDPNSKLDHCARVFHWLESVFGSEVLENFPFTFVNERFSSQDANKILERKNFKNQWAYKRARNRYAAMKRYSNIN